VGGRIRASFPGRWNGEAYRVLLTAHYFLGV